MALERYGIYPARIGDLLLRQIYGVHFSPNGNKTEKIVGGALDRSAVITSHATPTIRLMTNDFDGVLAGGVAVSPIAGLRVDTVNSPTTAATLIQYQPRVDGGTFDATAGNWLILTSTKGWVCIDEISAQQDDTNGAAITLMYHALSVDGITHPVQESTPGSVVSTPLFSGQWYLGPVLYNAPASGTLLEGITRVSIRPGIEYRTKSSEGAPFARYGHIHSRKPEIRMTLEKARVFYDLYNLFFGRALSGVSQLQFYFQKGIHGGTREAAVNAVHVRCLVQTGDLTPDDVSVENEDDVKYELVVRPTGTIAIATGVAIA